jgi:hypothetical protein
MQCVLRWHFMQAPVEISRQRTFQHEKKFLRRRHLHRTTATAPCLQQCDTGASALNRHATQCAAAALIQPRTASHDWRQPWRGKVIHVAVLSLLDCGHHDPPGEHACN